MLGPRPEEQWERFGSIDPYYGVYAREEFRSQALDESRRARFFASGDEHVEALRSAVRQLLGVDLAPRAVLDYGCGVGRLLIPLARGAERAVGLDVSESMLMEARRNCEREGITAELRPASDLAGMRAQFDLVHSALVLQHVPVRTGERIIAQLAAAMRPGGIGAIHLQIGGARLPRLYNVVMKLPLAHNVLNALRGRPWSYPHMQMNVYDLSRIARVLRDCGVSTLDVSLAERVGGYDACTLYFRATPRGPDSEEVPSGGHADRQPPQRIDQRDYGGAGE
jgi:2-polyprenyl-3-methyl-5-hydroxy-6-metoxy-1,4-benzoquinol methylase